MYIYAHTEVMQSGAVQNPQWLPGVFQSGLTETISLILILA